MASRAIRRFADFDRRRLTACNRDAPQPAAAIEDERLAVAAPVRRFHLPLAGGITYAMRMLLSMAIVCSVL